MVIRIVGVGLALLMAAAAPALAQGNSSTNKGATPNGKPFRQIQSQFLEVDQELQALHQQLQALQGQVSASEANLQAQIDAIVGTLGSQQGQIDSLAGATAALEGRVSAAEGLIGALSSAVADLEAQLAAAEGLLASHSGDLSQLQAQVTSIQVLINSHTSQIQAVEQQQQQMNQFLANLANGGCQAGEAIQAITQGGAIVCTQAGGSGTLQAYTNSAWNYTGWGYNAISVSCSPGDVATGSGFSVPSWYEALSGNNYVSYNWYDYGHNEYEYYWDSYYGYNQYFTYWDSDNVTIPYSYNYYSSYTSVSSVHSSYAASPSAYLQFQFTPQNNYYNYYGFSVYVNCLRLQP
jgi:predicted  nucleic acid-binding Zn-ribbon protein